jgi:hypothetical protein
MRLIRDDHSNCEIAEALFIMVGTDKRRTTSTSPKLEVGSRTQALATARSLNLIGASFGAATRRSIPVAIGLAPVAAFVIARADLVPRHQRRLCVSPDERWPRSG